MVRGGMAGCGRSTAVARLFVSEDAMERFILAAPLILICSAALADDRRLHPAGDVPASMQGTWGKNGRCDVPPDRLTITSTIAGWAEGYSGAVTYSADERAIHWDEEYETDNFVPGAHPDVIVHNTQGFHMPGQVGYARCGPDLARVPWPPKPGGRK
jgi:hypothetical protein